MRRWRMGITIVAAAAAVVAGCDAEQLVNHYFKSLGLNPLAVVRDDIKPGALVIKQKNKAVYTDSIFDFANAKVPEVKSENLDKSKDFQAVLKAHKSERKVDAEAALSFLKAVLPVDLSVDLGLTNSVTISAINAKGHRLPVPDVLKFLRNNSAPLHDFITSQGAGAEAYVAYETYEADTLNIVADSGTDVSTKLATTQEFKALSSGNASFKYARTAKETLVIKGDHPFVFAVRTGKLDYKNDVYSLLVTNFVSGDVKAVGGDEKYSSQVNEGFAPLAASRVERK